MYALSFYGSKMILTVQIILVEYLSFWTGPNHFGQVQIIKISPEKSNLSLTQMISKENINLGAQLL